MENKHLIDKELLKLAPKFVKSINNNDLEAIHAVDKTEGSEISFDRGYVDVLQLHKSVLTDVVSTGRWSLIKLFLDSGLNPNYVNAEGLSLLESAVRSNNIAIATMLIEYGADVNLKNKFGIGPIDCFNSEDYNLENLLTEAGATSSTDLDVIAGQMNLYAEVYNKLEKSQSFKFSDFISGEFYKLVVYYCGHLSLPEYARIKHHCENSYKDQYRHNFKTGRKALQRYYALVRIIESGNIDTLKSDFVGDAEIPQQKVQKLCLGEDSCDA